MRLQESRPRRRVVRSGEPRRGRPPSEVAADLRLSNWAAWSRGGLPGVVTTCLDRSDARPLVNEADAQAVELVVLHLRQRRPEYARLVDLQYQRGWVDATIERELRVTDRRLRDLRSRMLLYVAACLEMLDHVLPATVRSSMDIGVKSA